MRIWRLTKLMFSRHLRLIAVCCVTLGGILAQPLPTPLQHLGTYKLVFDEEFNALDLSPNGLGDHTWYEGIWYNHNHAPLSSISIDSSVLSLKRLRNQGSFDTSVTTLAHDNHRFRAWRYGYFEARLKWDVVKGAWPAFWLIPVQDATREDVYAGVRESGEIDIFEGQGDHPHVIYSTVHDWVNNKDSANQNNVVRLDADIDLSQFHEYGLLWTKEKLTWYLDGRPVHTEEPPAILDKQDFYIVIGMQEGVNWKEGDESGVSSSVLSMSVDWVRVWQQ